MNKLELTEILRNKISISRSDAKAAVNLFFDNMSSALIRGDRIEIRGLCSFYVKNYKGYMGRNPKTGEKLIIGPKKQPHFKAGKALKKKVDN